ncbi:MAG TPA: hypothetical protein VEP89_16705, partial [Draconibacterium sp.]|nr:hypothetical protein [Draconibacterium sp.]
MKISIVFWLLVFNQLSFSCKPDIVVSQDTNRNRSFMPLEVQNGRLMVTINFEDSVPAKILIDNGASNVLLDSSFVNNHKELNIQFLSKVMLNLKYPMGVVRTKISSSELSMLLANDTFKTSHIWVNDIRSWFYEDTISGIIPLHVFYKEDSYLNLDLFDKKVYYTDSIDTTQYIK